MKQRIIIHIGLPKTATTFLQTEVFPNLENTNFLRSFNSFYELYYSKGNNFENILISDEMLSGLYFKGDPLKNYKKNIQLLKTIFNNHIGLLSKVKRIALVLLSTITKRKPFPHLRRIF